MALSIVNAYKTQIMFTDENSNLFTVPINTIELKLEKESLYATSNSGGTFLVFSPLIGKILVSNLCFKDIANKIGFEIPSIYARYFI